MTQNLKYRKVKIEDLKTIIALLTDDELGKNRETVDNDSYQKYEAAFIKINKDENQFLMVVENDQEIVATCHLSIIYSMTFTGAVRMQIEAVRVAQNYVRQGIGKWMFEKATQYAKSRDVSIIQLTTNKQRDKAKSFYESLGFEATHEGMKLYLVT